MIIPVGTDAPIYHRPITTIGLILANATAFWITDGGTDHAGWILRPGYFDPREWISSAFLHFGAAHLIGNMLFLWTFGLIIEGKLGWWKFLSLYLGLCAADGCAGQLFMLADHGHSLGAGGASGVIFAMMAISLVWAPKNNIDFVWLWGIGFWIRLTEIDFSVIMVSLFYVGMNLLSAYFVDFELSTPVLHLIGAFLGFPIGLLFLKKGWVDCENWDLLSVLKGKHRKGNTLESYRIRAPMEELLNKTDLEYRQKVDPRRELKAIRRLINRKLIPTAWSRYRKLRDAFPDEHMDEKTLRQFIEVLRQRSLWSDLTTLLKEYIETYSEKAVRAQLMLAGILVKELNRPQAALHIIESIPNDDLSTQQRQFLRDVRSYAENQIEAGVLELQEL